MESNKGQRPAVSRYLAALLAPTVIAGMMQLTWPLFVRNAVEPFLFAVVFSAWYGGFGPGLLCIIVSFLAADFFFMEPYFRFWPPGQTNTLNILLFASIAPFICLLSELRRKEKERAALHLNALILSEGRYRQLAQNFPNGTVITYNKDLRVTFIDGTGLQAMGASAVDFVGKLLEDIVPVEVLAVAEPHFRAAFEGSVEIYECPFPDGRAYLAVVAPLPDGNGLVDEILVISQDITERKRAEETLCRMDALVESSEDAIIGKKLDGTITSWNKGAEKLYGYAAKEMIHRHIGVLALQDRADDIADILAKLARGESIQHYETERVAKDGTPRHVSLTISVIKSRSGQIVGASTIARDITARKWAEYQLRHDVTERKQVEARLRATTEQLRALSARLQTAREDEGTRIAREIHDELGAALASLRWDLEDVEESVSEPRDESQIRELREKLIRMRKLTGAAITTVKRIASELRPPALEVLGLIDAIESEARQFQLRTKIIVECGSTLETVDLSREQSTAVFRIFQEALTNILSHAQATRVEIQMNETGDEFILTITDNGRGITDREQSGEHALGLLGMRERAQLVLGKIDIAGSDGNGTVITVRIPISKTVFETVSSME